MSEPAITHAGAVEVAASPEAVYDLVADVTRTGEWSPVCRRCEWLDGGTGAVGDRFAGHNEDGDRRWTTTSTVVAAERGREFAWVVSDGLVRWRYLLEPASTGTTLREEWTFTPEGIAFFRAKYGPDADTQIANRVDRAHTGIPATLAAIKRIAEGDA